MVNQVKPDDEMLSIGQAAELSGHTIATYRWYRATATGPRSWKCGRHVRYWRSDIIRWMAAQEAATSRGGAQ